MTSKQLTLSENLKTLGFRQENQMKLYGKVFELLGEPIVLADDLVVMDAIEKKSGQFRRIRVPLPVVNMARNNRKTA